MSLERAEAGSPTTSAEIGDTRSALLSGIFTPFEPAVNPEPRFAGAIWRDVQPIFQNASSVQFTTAADNVAAKVEPDYILGTDGILRDNPAKAEPPADGKVNIQIEAEAEANSSEIEAKKVANENQKKSVREMIDYFRKFNPNSPVPQHWLDMLDSQPDLPSSTPRQRQPEAPVQTQPQPRQEVSAPAPQRSVGGGGGGGYSSGGSGGGYRGGSSGGAELARDPEVSRSRPRVELPAPIAGDMTVEGAPTITPEKINQILEQYNSPAAGLGQHIYDKGVETGINPAVALAFFIQESSAGTAGVAERTKSWGNIKGEGPAGSDSGFRKYNTYEEGVDDWYRLIKEKYLAPPSEGGFGAKTLSQIISKYAPSSDNNNEAAYVANVKGMVKGWQANA